MATYVFSYFQIDLIFKAVGLAMGVAVNSALTMVGVGLACFGISQFTNSKYE